MENYYQMIKRHKREIEELQEGCNHSNTKWYSSIICSWKVCLFCDKELEFNSPYELSYGEKITIPKLGMITAKELK